MAALGDCRNGISCSNNFMFSPCIKYVSSELMELRPAVDVVPTLQCMMVMYGLGILAIDRLKESCQPIMGNGPLGNDVSVPNRKRTYTRKCRSKKSMLCHGCKKSFTYKKRLLTHKQTCAGVTVCPCMQFPCVIRSGYLVLANQHTSSEGQGSRDLRQTRVEPY